MFRLVANKIGSASKNIPLAKELRVSPEVTAEEGYIVAVRVIGSKSVYNELEDCNGRMVPLHDGDIVVGVLGHRNALHGYTGIVPEKIAPGDILNILNLGGVIGKCTSNNPEVGKPFDVEVLGSVLVFPEFEKRQGVPAHVKMRALPQRDLASAPNVPVIFIAGTCMNSGKTQASCSLIRTLASKGLVVGGCKLTGVSLLKDVLRMGDYGAKYGLSFVDAGTVTTSPETAVEGARRIIANLLQKNPDVVVAELGDGILGEYGVQEILSDDLVMSRKSALVLCAADPVGVWGGVKYLKEVFGHSVDVISGPVTDNAVGVNFIERTIGLRAINARTRGGELGEYVYSLIGAQPKPNGLAFEAVQEGV